jgi:tetratricopeptide (TPR) repeat protein
MSVRNIHITLLGAAFAAFGLAGCGHSAQTGAPPATSAPAAFQPSLPDAARQMVHLPSTVADWAQGAMLFEGLGSTHRDIGTASAEAGRYFDQGMRLMWAFNHDESTRSFAKAAQLDPACAICFWGVALTVGPNYNLPVMEETRAKVAWQALGKARENAAHASPVEQALITALAQRYPAPKPLDPSNSGPILTAYAQAMKTVAVRFPEDLDVQTLYAESLMNLNAWKLWTPEGKPAPGTEEIVATLESVLRRDPAHPGANHYYVHTLEASPHPEQAVAAAERLRGMMPAAGHLEHMPAHILQRVGRYEEAAEANRKGAAADLKYFEATKPLDYYGMYTAHNYQFLAYSTAMEGRRAETLAAVRHERAVVPDQMLLAMPGLDWYVAEIYTAPVRFGAWDELLAASPPNSSLRALTGGYWYGRGMALAATGRLEESKVALAELDKTAASLSADAPAGNNNAKDLLAIGSDVVKARIASAEHRTDDAIAALQRATVQEDKLAYNEPKDWFFPVRHLLGAELLKAGRATEAERIYREDLQQNPGNGWSLYGLARSLEAQHKSAEAARVDEEFRTAWARADVTLTSSAF